MLLNISKKKVISLMKDTQFYEVTVEFDISSDEAILSKYFEEDFIITLHVNGARERGHTLTASRPVTKVRLNIKSNESTILLFAHQSDANIFIERIKEQAGKVLEMLRSKSEESSDFDEELNIEI